MTFGAFAKANFETALAGPAGEDISYRPGGDAGSAFTIRAVVDRRPFVREEHQGAEQRQWVVLVMRDPAGTSPPTGVVAPAKGDTIVVDRYLGGDSTVTARVEDLDLADDELWELEVVW